jgi:hypothetical protein
MPAWLVVRAVVPDPADRAGFGRWYRTEHLPDAVKAFSARAAWRGWSQTDPSIHCAYYRFDSVEAADAIQRGPAIQALIEAFDRAWNGKVTRTREVIDVADEQGG